MVVWSQKDVQCMVAEAERCNGETHGQREISEEIS